MTLTCPPLRRRGSCRCERGLHVHMGRINTHRRPRYAAAIGCHSADGTYLAYGPDKNLPKLLHWLNDIGIQGTARDPQSTRGRVDIAPTPRPDPTTTQTPRTGPLAMTHGHTPHIPASAGPDADRLAGRSGPAAATVPVGIQWTAHRIRALGAVTDLQTAAKIFGLSRTTAYELARTDQFPVPVLRFGTRYRVPVPAILSALGLLAGDDEPTIRPTARDGEPLTGGRLDPGPDPRVDHGDTIRCPTTTAPPPDPQGES
jgi:hypothetical protein